MLPGILGLVGVALFVVATLVPYAGGIYFNRRLAPTGPAAVYALMTTSLWLPASALLAATGSVMVLRRRSALGAGLLTSVGAFLGVQFVGAAIPYWATGGFEPGSLVCLAAVVLMLVAGIAARPAGTGSRAPSLPAAAAAIVGTVAIVAGNLVPYIVQTSGGRSIAQARVSLEAAARGMFGSRVSLVALAALLVGSVTLALRVARGRSSSFLAGVLAGVGIPEAAASAGWLAFSLRSTEFEPALGSYLLVLGGLTLAWAGIASARGATSGSGGNGRPEPRPAAAPAS